MKKMKILGICGSPRNGNSEFALKFLLKDIRGKNIEKKIVLLRTLKINFKESMLAKKVIHGYLKDDVDKIFDKMKQADIIALSCPTYFDMPPALMKIFIDRCSPFYYKPVLKGKKAILLVCGGAKVGEGYIEANMKNLIEFCKMIKLNIIAKIVFSADSKNEASKNSKLKSQLKSLAKKLSK